MSSSSSKPEAPPPINPQLQHESTLINIPPDPDGNPTVSLNNQPILNPQNGNQTQTITFRQIIQYCWRGIDNNEYRSNHNTTIDSPPTPPQIWLAQNVYPLVTPMRMICFFLSQISFFLAYAFYMQTEHYNTHVASVRLILFVAANIGSFLLLSFLLFFSFLTAAYERYLHHYLLKSIGEVMVMLFMTLLILGIGSHKHHQEGSSEVAGLVTCAFLTIYSLCIIILLKPGHHYSLLDATATLTLHLGLVGIYGIPAAVFIFAILITKNYIWSKYWTCTNSNL